MNKTRLINNEIQIPRQNNKKQNKIPKLQHKFKSTYGAGSLSGSLWDERLVYLGNELLFSFASFMLIVFSGEPRSSDLVSLVRVEALEFPFMFSLLVSLHDGTSLLTSDIAGLTIPLGAI